MGVCGCAYECIVYAGRFGYMCVYVFVCVWVCVCVCVCALCTHGYMCMCVCVCVYVVCFWYVCVCVSHCLCGRVGMGMCRSVCVGLSGLPKLWRCLSRLIKILTEEIPSNIFLNIYLHESYGIQ